MGIQVKEIVAAMEEWAPKRLAESWDNVGLLVGNPNSEISAVLTALDVTKENVAYAIQNGIGMIVAHHPLIFKPLKSLATGTLQTDLLAELQKNEIAVYAAHTNLDIAVGGVNDNLAKMLGLGNIRGLVRTGEEKAYKLTVYVPSTHANEVRDAIGGAGAGYIGKYSHCSFTAEGRGRFLPEEGTNPYIGTKGRMEVVREERIETVVRENDLSKVLATMLAVHPYEEVAYDIYPLVNGGKVHWLGRVGEWEREVSVEKAFERIRKALGIPVLRYAGATNGRIQRIALCSGSGMDFYRDAKEAAADLYLTGDIRYHDAQDAVGQGLLIVDGHHFYTEQHVANILATYLKKYAEEAKKDFTVVEDESRKDIFSFHMPS